jgi:GH25 family lysozyme M1 (1,4-beta-N-acetylmuramidase)
VLTLTSHSSRPSPLAIVLMAVLAATALFAATSLAAPAPTLAATNREAACAGVALRTRPSTSATRKAVLSTGMQITAVTTVSGRSWRVTCNGRTVSGSSWYRITAVQGYLVSRTYGVTYLYAATGLFRKVTSATLYAECDGIALRRTPSTTSTREGLLSKNSKVVATALVAGKPWSKTCGGTFMKGTRWYRISAVNGESVSSRYGVAYVYVPNTLFSPQPTTATPPKESSNGSGMTEGIDVSHWQGTIDWSKVRAAGKRFAFIKASEHTSFVDNKYQTNRANAKAAGLKIGAYHFARPNSGTTDAYAEADHFIETADWKSGELRPVLDLEDTGGLSSSSLQTWVKAFLQRIYDRTGVRAIIYVSPSFWSTKMANSTWFAKNGYDVLWIAHWTTASSPSVPADNWGGKGWTFWQYTSDGSVSGISGRVDLNRYKGTDLGPALIP